MCYLIEKVSWIVRLVEITLLGRTKVRQGWRKIRLGWSKVRLWWRNVSLWWLWWRKVRVWWRKLRLWWSKVRLWWINYVRLGRRKVELWLRKSDCCWEIQIWRGGHNCLAPSHQLKKENMANFRFKLRHPFVTHFYGFSREWCVPWTVSATSTFFTW
jgi:hypothetical protein